MKVKDLIGQNARNRVFLEEKPWLLKGDGTPRNEGEGEWVITYTPPSGGINHSRALSRYAPHLLNDHAKIEEVRKAAVEIIKSQLDNPQNKEFVNRRRDSSFGLAWIEEYNL